MALTPAGNRLLERLVLSTIAASPSLRAAVPRAATFSGIRLAPRRDAIEPRFTAYRPVSATTRRTRRVLVLSAAALVIGAIGAVVAKALLWLIDVITNLAYFGRLSAAPVDARAERPRRLEHPGPGRRRARSSA